MSQTTPQRRMYEEAAVQAAISDAEDMLAQAANATGEQAADLRHRALRQLRSLRAKLSEPTVAVNVDEFVHAQPWLASVIGLTLGVIAGLAVRRVFAHLLQGDPTTPPPPPPIIPRRRLK